MCVYTNVSVSATSILIRWVWHHPHLSNKKASTHCIWSWSFACSSYCIGGDISVWNMFLTKLGAQGFSGAPGDLCWQPRGPLGALGGEAQDSPTSWGRPATAGQLGQASRADPEKPKKQKKQKSRTNRTKTKKPKKLKKNEKVKIYILKWWMSQLKCNLSPKPLVFLRKVVPCSQKH